MEPQKPCDKDDEVFMIIVGDKEDKQIRSRKRKKVLENNKDVSISDNHSSGDEDLVGPDKQDQNFSVNVEGTNVGITIDDMEEEYIVPDINYDSSDDEPLDTKQCRARWSSLGTEEKRPRRMRLLNQAEQKSFVNELREMNPELKEDKQALIEALSLVMADLKCPSPPDNFLTVTDDEEFKCGYCGVEKYSKMAVARHWQERHGPRYLICYACGADFRSITNLYKHEKRCDSPDALIVLKARANKQRNSNVGRPFILPAGDKPNYPDTCISLLRKKHPELVNDKELLITMLVKKMEMETPPIPPGDFFIQIQQNEYKCAECKWTDKTKMALARHWQCTHGPRYLECYACKKAFRDARNLYKHEKRCISNDAYVVLMARARCAAAKGRGRPHALSARLKEEGNKKDGDRKSDGPVTCPMCPATFKSRKYMRGHELLHTGQRPYRCDECAAHYTSATALSRHRKTHEDNTFLCDKCDRTFKCRGSLKNHMKTHLPKYKHACPQCGKEYAQKFALRIHVDRDHRRLPPPLACQFCPKRYPRMSLLKVHMLQKHGMKLITRNMFHRSLPHLSDSELKNIKVVKKDGTNIAPSVQSEQIEEIADETKDVEEIADESKDVEEIADESKDIEPFEQEISIGSVKSEEFHSQFNKEDETEQFEYTDVDMTEEENNIQETHHIDIPKETVAYENKLSREANIATSAIDEPEINEDKEEKPSDYLMEYAKKLQRSSRPKPFVVMKDGQAIFIDENNIDFYKRNVVTQVKQHTVNSEPKTEDTTSLLPQTNTMIKEEVASSSVATVNTKMRPTLRSPKIESKTRRGRKNAKSK